MNELRDFKEWLEYHLDDLKDKAPGRKQEINGLYAEVTLAYEQSLNATLILDEELRAIATELATIQDDINHRMERTEDIADIIGKIATGVGIATKIAGILIKT